MKMKAFALSLLLIASGAQAALVKSDWYFPGDNHLTTDTATGLDWMTLSNTHGMSINAAIAATAAGKPYAGWRIAYASEVEGLFRAAFPSLTFNAEYTSFDGGADYKDAALNWLNLMGTAYYVRQFASQTENKYHYSYGMYLGENGAVEQSGVYYRETKINGVAQQYTVNIIEDHVPGYSQDSFGNMMGVFLVRNNPLYPPAGNQVGGAPSDVTTTTGFGALSLMGLAFFGLKRRRSLESRT